MTNDQKAEAFDWLAKNWREVGRSNMADGSVSFLLLEYSRWGSGSPRPDFATALDRIRTDLLDVQLAHFDRWVERYSE